MKRRWQTVVRFASYWVSRRKKRGVGLQREFSAAIIGRLIMAPFRLSFALWFLVVVAPIWGATPRVVDFNRDVRPILSDNCIACHGPDKEKRKAKLRLDVADESQSKIVDSGKPAISPKHPEQSELISRVSSTDEDEVMPPPKTGKKLTAAQIQTLRDWIVAGAPYAQHWSFIKPVRVGAPVVKLKSWPRNAIDNFVLARLEKENIAPSQEADRVTLLRRASLDVIGLPPTPEEVAVTNASWEAVIERLLESPHYGERWGRHWLDLARYADSNGYSIDAPRSIWKYRDWVIDAFNRDMPFDEFTIEQIAGDLLPNATQEQKIATGFHRNTQINEEGGIDKEQFRIESVIDRVNTTGATFLGLTVGCAQCHDHKFDPISQRDYYEMFAFLNNADEPDMVIGSGEQNSDLTEARYKVTDLARQIEVFKQDSEKNADKIKEATAQLNKLRRALPKMPTTMVMAERKEPRESYIFIKGDFTRHGDVVGPGVLDALHPLKPTTERTNRLDLARWLVDRENPLTARVVVNRIWEKYFGRGLVETENDFGSQGSLPTHPELLDWLAGELMDYGWSQKHIHRLILNSATYRQSSNVRQDLLNVDANNYLLARQNRLRLDAEVVRDVALKSAGLLTEKIGGPSVFPPQPEGVMNLGQSRREWKASEGADRYRRAMYTFFWRATPHPSLTVFDAPDAFSACTRRPRSNTPLQSLTLLNDQASYEFAEALAQRVIRERKDDKARLSRAFQLCLSRQPSDGETERLQKLLEEMRPDGEEKSWATVARVLLNLDETITRE
jgi:hypothetical protein